MEIHATECKTADDVRLAAQKVTALRKADRAPSIVEIVPRDHAADVMDIIVAAVANAMSIPATEIMRGLSSPDTISARRLAMAMCVRHPRFSAERVAEHFEIGETTVNKAVSMLDPILDSYVITRKTRLEISLPLIVKEWCAVESVHRRRPTMERVVTAVSEVFNENLDDILSHRKVSDNLRTSRHTAIGLCRGLTLKSLPEIGRFFNGRDHTSILYSVGRFRPVFAACTEKLSPAATPEMWAIAACEELIRTPLARIK